VPVVRGGVVYTQIESDSRYDGVYAYRAGDGKQLWRSLVGIVNNGAALFRSTLYYSSECNEALAISTITHAIAWGHREACTGGGGGFPVIGDGLLWIRNWGPVTDEALNIGDGSVARTIHSDAPPVVDGTLAITRSGSTLAGEDAASGQVRWSFTGDGHLTGNAIAANGVVYIGSTQGTLFGVSEQTGKQVWSGPLGAAVHDWDDPGANLGMFGGPALGGGLLLIPAGTRLIAFRSADQKPPAALRPVPLSRISYGATTQTLDATSYQIGAEHGGRQPRPLPRPLRMVWRKRLSGTVGYPLIVAGRVFAASDTGVAAPTVKAFSLRTGALLWTHALAPADTGFVGLASDHGRIMAQTYSGRMYAYAAATGRGLWHARLPEDYEGFEAYQFDTAPVARNGIVYTVGEGFAAIVYAVHDGTGKVAWRRSLNWASQGAPAVTPRSLIVSYGALTRAYALTTGVVRWTTAHGDNGTGVPPSIHDGAVYVTDKDFYNRIVTLAHGAQLDQSYSSSTTPAFDGGLKLVLADNLLEAENSRTGTIRWRFSGDGGLLTTPLIVGHRAFVGSSSGLLYALNDHTGRVTWKTKEPAPFLPNNTRYSTGTSTLTGLNAGDGYLAVPAGETLTVYR
jgi:outer membrane protein assembly factor BamB